MRNGNVDDFMVGIMSSRTAQALPWRENFDVSIEIIIINALFRKMVQTMSSTGDFQWAIIEMLMKYTPHRTDRQHRNRHIEMLMEPLTV